MPRAEPQPPDRALRRCRGAGARTAMRGERAETVANVIVAAAGIGLAVVIVRTPMLRRLAWRLAVTAVTTGVPAWVGREVQEAWAASAPAAGAPPARARTGTI